MRIFLAGAAGAIGKRLVPALCRAGHEVVGTARSAATALEVEGLGARPVVLDVFDRVAVAHAIAAANADAIVHELTALPNSIDFRKFDAAFELTNRLRTEALDAFIVAAREVGVRRFIAQSFTGWPNARTGTAPKSETDPLDADPLPRMRAAIDAIRYLEHAVTTTPGIQGFALRYGSLYGPGTSIGRGGAVCEAIEAGKIPIVGSGAGVWSFLHIDDAASATRAALTCDTPGIYNIVDDEPAPVRVWLPCLANAMHARAQKRVPAWIARWFIGSTGVVMMTEIRGSSHAKAKRLPGWTPACASWREGVPREFAA
jgi:nucleoside-diphosphate-sugar epimerase